MDAAEQLMRTVRGRYDQLVAERVLERDPAQAELASRLDLLSEQLGQTTLAVKGSSLGWLFGRSRPKQPFIRGLYIHGSVGRGKTMLMDLFFERVAVRAKRRAHFHAFMADVQDRIHQARQDILAGRLSGNDPIVHVAAAIAGETKLLCFDEFAVNDIADAMILGRLFARLFELGTVMVATSNVVPRRLYWDGLNRALFLPFIDLLNANVDVFELDARTDYRSERQDFGEVYFSPLGPGADAAVEALWRDLAGGGGAPVDIQFRGRKIHVPCAARGAVSVHGPVPRLFQRCGLPADSRPLRAGVRRANPRDGIGPAQRGEALHQSDRHVLRQPRVDRRLGSGRA